ncbi:hypothetical protein BLNAU_4487 [Blattamonas nauphoetae]|uniref:Uncharacterized protein n=1 Tax=Blattamonas nauphoetae TaxID=2049346 RepID=A0ABQ9YAB2_9EUKA|nr:hypothetical protein BLNAU_4487 [Blattamonas nauphoetae]
MKYEKITPVLAFTIVLWIIAQGTLPTLISITLSLDVRPLDLALVLAAALFISRFVYIQISPPSKKYSPRKNKQMEETLFSAFLTGEQLSQASRRKLRYSLIAIAIGILNKEVSSLLGLVIGLIGLILAAYENVSLTLYNKYKSASLYTPQTFRLLPFFITKSFLKKLRSMIQPLNNKTSQRRLVSFHYSILMFVTIFAFFFIVSSAKIPSFFKLNDFPQAAAADLTYNINETSQPFGFLSKVFSAPPPVDISLRSQLSIPFMIFIVSTMFVVESFTYQSVTLLYFEYYSKKKTKQGKLKNDPIVQLSVTKQIIMTICSLFKLNLIQFIHYVISLGVSLFFLRSWTREEFKSKGYEKGRSILIQISFTHSYLSSPPPILPTQPPPTTSQPPSINPPTYTLDGSYRVSKTRQINTWSPFSHIDPASTRPPLPSDQTPLFNLSVPLFTIHPDSLFQKETEMFLQELYEDEEEQDHEDHQENSESDDEVSILKFTRDRSSEFNSAIFNAFFPDTTLPVKLNMLDRSGKSASVILANPHLILPSSFEEKINPTVPFSFQSFALRIQTASILAKDTPIPHVNTKAILRVAFGLMRVEDGFMKLVLDGMSELLRIRKPDELLSDRSKTPGVVQNEKSKQKKEEDHRKSEDEEKRRRKDIIRTFQRQQRSTRMVQALSMLDKLEIKLKRDVINPDWLRQHDTPSAIDEDSQTDTPVEVSSPSSNAGDTIVLGVYELFDLICTERRLMTQASLSRRRVLGQDDESGSNRSDSEIGSETLDPESSLEISRSSSMPLIPGLQRKHAASMSPPPSPLISSSSQLLDPLDNWDSDMVGRVPSPTNIKLSSLNHRSTSSLSPVIKSEEIPTVLHKPKPSSMSRTRSSSLYGLNPQHCPLNESSRVHAPSPVAQNHSGSVSFSLASRIRSPSPPSHPRNVNVLDDKPEMKIRNVWTFSSSSPLPESALALHKKSSLQYVLQHVGECLIVTLFIFSTLSIFAILIVFPIVRYVKRIGLVSTM